MFDLRYPVMSAPMALHSGGALAGAVSEAGGLGSFGAMHPEKGPDWTREQIAAIRVQTERAFAVGFITPFLPHIESTFEAALTERPPVMAFSFADPRPWSDRAKEFGAQVMCQVQDFESADAAVDAGADILVAQGNEAGGHTGTMGLLPFLAALVGRYPDVPVLAAGGIADGRTLAAALTAGADGVWMGTAFLATPEAVEVPDNYKERIVASDGTDTVYTSVYDIASGLPWPDGIGDRVRRTKFTDEWHDREAELRERRDEIALPDESDPEIGPVRYGPAARFVDAVAPAAEVLRTVCDDAEQIMRTRPPSLLD
jgi:nitronate monooxygenase